MKPIKNMPTWLANSIFVKITIDDNKNENVDTVELEGSDIDVFFSLIYLTSQSYDFDKNTPKKLEYSYKLIDIRKVMEQKANINNSLIKLDGLQIASNIFESYGEKGSVIYKPFRITLQKDKSNPKIIGKAKITVEEDFIKAFTKPNPKFTLSYELLSEFSNPQAKLLYILLFNHLGDVSIGQSKHRNIPVEALAPLMNKPFDYSLTQLKRVVKSSIKLINAHKDIKIKDDDELAKEKKHRYGYDDNDIDEEVLKCRFEITRVKQYPKYIKKDDIDESNEDSSELTRDEIAWKEARIEAKEILEDRKKDKNAKKINLEDNWLDTTQKDIYEKKLQKQQKQDQAEQQKQETVKQNKQRAEEELEKSKALIDELLVNEKDILRDKIDESKGTPLIMFEVYSHYNEKTISFYINQEYQYTETGKEKPKCEDANETYKYLMNYSEERDTVIKYTDMFYDIYEKMYL